MGFAAAWHQFAMTIFYYPTLLSFAPNPPLLAAVAGLPPVRTARFGPASAAKDPSGHPGRVAPW